MTKLTKEELAARTAAEDRLPFDELNPEQQKRRLVRERKRKQRSGEKQEREAATEAADLSNYKTAMEFWAAQQAKLPPKELEKMLARHDDLLLLVDCMRDYVQYGLESTTQQDLDDTIEEVKQELKHGEVLVEITLIEKFWLDKPFFDAVIERCRPTATFARYGLLEALPAHSIHDFRGKFMRPAPKGLSDTQEWTTMFCSQCPPERRLESSRCVKTEIAQQYADKKLPFLCHRCRDSEAEARKLSAQT